MRKTIKFIYWLMMSALFLILVRRERRIEQLKHIEIK